MLILKIAITNMQIMVLLSRLIAGTILSYLYQITNYLSVFMFICTYIFIAVDVLSVIFVMTIHFIRYVYFTL